MRVREKTNELEEAIAWFLDFLQSERGASPNTVSAYGGDLSQIASVFSKLGGKSWSEFAEPSAAAVRASFAKRGLATTTIQRKTAALRSLLKFLSARGHGPTERLPDAAGLRRPRRLPKALSVEGVEALMAQPDISKAAGLRNRAMLELLYGAGLRVSELIGLKLEHYSGGESLLRVHGKREKTRLVPLPACTHDWLRNYLENARPRLVKKGSTTVLFLNHRGRQLSRSGVFKLLRSYARAAGIETEVGPHTLRHTYAVHLVQAGADLRSVQELLGHTSVATTEVYTQLDMNTVKRKYLKAHPRAKS